MTTSVAAMTPNAGNNADATRKPSVSPRKVPPSSSAIKIPRKATARPMKLQGNASRNDAINGNSPRRRITGTARRSKAAKSLEAADDGFDATDDLDIARVDWRHCAILRLQTDTPRLTVEALDRGLAVEHCDDDFAIFGASLGTNDDQIAIENRSLHHRIALHAQHERVGDPRHEPS